MLQTQPHQPDHMPASYGEDRRSDFEIQEELRQLNREMDLVLRNALQHYNALRARQAYDDAEIEQRLARRRETFNWLPPEPRPAPFSMPLARQPQIHHLHAGRMGVIVEEERRTNSEPSA